MINIMEGTHSRIHQTEEIISEIQDGLFENTQLREKNKTKQSKKEEDLRQCTESVVQH